VRHDEALSRLPELLGVHPAGPDEAELRVHLEECRACGQRLEALRRVNTTLRTTGAAAPPPARLERRVLDIPGRESPDPTRRRRGARVAIGGLAAVLVALAAVLVALAVALGVVLAGDDPVVGFTAVRTVPLATTVTTDVEAAVELGAPHGEQVPVRVLAAGLAHGSGTYYGLWVTGPSGAVSGGSFQPDGQGRCAVLMQVPAGEWTTVAITAGDRPPSARTTVARAAL